MKCAMKSNIDFVVAWVDGNDPVWKEKKIKYLNKEKVDDISLDSSEARYRDWEIFKYWFRSVEENAPWVHRIFLVTDHQVPDFLLDSHPKLKIVYHDDYIPKKYLPTFSANPIELNFHRIKELSETFVYFNDDMFLNQRVRPEDFFVDGLPCYDLIERPFAPIAPLNPIHYMVVNDMSLVNKHFSRKDVTKHFTKFVNIKYGKSGIKNLCMLPWRKIQFFQDNHMPCPFLKSTFQEVWDTEYTALDEASTHKFRTCLDLNQYLFKYWDQARGNFSPYSFKGGYYLVNKTNVSECISDIMRAMHMMICLNDGVANEDYEIVRHSVIEAFEKRYPANSSFER